MHDIIPIIRRKLELLWHNCYLQPKHSTQNSIQLLQKARSIHSYSHHHAPLVRRTRLQRNHSRPLFVYSVSIFVMTRIALFATPTLAHFKHLIFQYPAINIQCNSFWNRACNEEIFLPQSIAALLSITNTIIFNNIS